MFQPAALIVLLPAIALFCQGELITNDLPWFSFKKTKITKYEECEEIVEISGKEIQFQIKLTCDTAKNLKEIIKMDSFIVGDYRRSYMSFYSDNPGSLVVVEGTRSKTCTELLREGVSEMTELQCDHVKMNMERVWDDSYKQDVSSDFVVRRMREFKNGQCVETIKFFGNGGGDSPNYVCEAGRNLEWMYVDGGLVLGNFKRNGVSFYSRSFGTFITIGSDKKCFKKEAAEGRLVDASINEEECEEVKRAVEGHWNRKYMRDAGSTFEVEPKPRVVGRQCKEIFEVKGNGIYDEATFDCNPKNPVEVLYTPNGFILADLKNWREKCYYSDSPNSMVVVTHRLGRECSRMEYEAGQAKQETMSTAQCNEVKQLIDEHVSQYESGTEVLVSRKVKHVNKECKEYVEIKGYGIYDILTIDCDSDRKLMYFPSGFLLGDVRKQHVCLFSDTPSRVAMIDHRSKTCKLLTYKVNRKVVSDLDAKDCDKVRNVIEKHLSGKYKD